MIHELSLLLTEQRLPVPSAELDEFTEQVTRGFVELFER